VIVSSAIAELEAKLTDILTKNMPSLKGDPIIQIGTTVHIYGSDKIVYRHIATLNSCDEIADAEVECFDTEEDLICGWKDLIVRLDPDIITGYNIFGFDMDYIWSRARELGKEEELAVGFGRLNDRQTTLLEQKLSSSALGDNILKYIDMDGVVAIDMFKVMQRDHKLDSYKLDNVASVFLGDHKEDLKPKDIFQKFGGTSADRRDIATYCLQDCALCNRLMHKLKVLENNVGMGNVCSVPLSYLFMRGQGVKIFSLVAKECRAKNYLIPVLKGFNPNAEDDSDGYEGAIVLEPKEGIYLEDPITVLDYSSLYPSSMIARNLSHDCFVNDDTYAKLEDQGISYLTVTYDVYEGVGDKKRCVGKKECTFAQLPNGEKGIIPSILQKLLTQRKNTRKKIEYERVYLKDGRVAQGVVTKENDDGSLEMLNVDHADLGRGFGGHKAIIEASLVDKREPAFTSFEQAVLDALQLAFKITANSLYGQIGSRTSPIYWKDIAACTTATGREMIMTAKNFVEEKYGAEVVYGDSVAGDTPLLIRDRNGMIHVKTIETLSNEWIDYENFRPWDRDRRDKEQTGFEGEVWSNGKWAKIARVIRHKVNKRMFRVNTFQGCVDVTEDHSLLTSTGAPIKPYDCQEGASQLLHSFPSHAHFLEHDMVLPRFQKLTQMEDVYSNCHDVKERILTKEEAWVMGLFFADGGCGDYCNTMSWAINTQNLDTLSRAKAYLEHVEPSEIVTFKIVASSHVYKLVPVGSFIYMVEKYSSLFYDKDKLKMVPSLIMNASKEIKKWFVDGYLSGDESKAEELNFVCKGKIGSMGIYTLLRMIGHTKVRVNIIRVSEPNIYAIRTISDEEYFHQKQNTVIHVQELENPHGQYVYDIETSEGMFNAGVGSLVVSNTDSIFIKFTHKATDGTPIYGKDALPLAIAAGQRASREIKGILPPPQCLEYEKTFYPFILFSKKRYVGNLYEDDATKKPKQKSMGIVLKRRDNANIVKKVYGGIIDIIMNKQDLNASVTFLREQLQALVDGHVDLQDLVITKTLKAEYKDPTKIAHKVLADRMAQRDPGNKPMANDRIPFVYIRPPPGVEVKLQGDRIEHPEFIKENNITPDYRFYITNQLINPITQLYALCVEKLPDYSYSPGYWTQIEEELMGKELYRDNDKKRKDRITTLRMREVEDLLFESYTSQLEEVGKKRAAPKKPTKKQLAAENDLKNPYLVDFRITEKGEKGKREYECVAQVRDAPDGEPILTVNESIPKKRQTTTKQYCYRYIAEQACRKLSGLSSFDRSRGITFELEDKTFHKDWKNAIQKAHEIRALLKAAIDTQDIGTFQQLQEQFVYENLVNMLDAFKYVLRMKK
jgi:DNA polymerase elongation subunit (family B)